MAGLHPRRVSSRCPADVDVPAFVAAIAAGDPGGAAATIFAENILGGTCARVCPVEVLCQRDCVLVHEGRRPIEIGALQRYATEWAYANGVPLRDPAAPNGKRVAVVGAGPAGLAAAGELAARGYAVTVYDERAEVGGLVRYGIAPYRQTNEPLPDEARLLAELGVEFRLRTRIDAARLEELEAEFDAIVVAVGMGADVDVSYEGDDLQGVWESLPFIEHLKTGKAGSGRTGAWPSSVAATPPSTSRSRRSGSARTSRSCFTGAPSTRCPPTSTRSSSRGAKASRSASSRTRSRSSATATSRASVVRRCDSATPTRAAAGGRSRSREASSLSRSTSSSRRSDSGRATSSARCSSPSTPTVAPPIPKIFAAGDAVNGGASVVQAVREAKRAVSALDESLRCAS